MGEMGVWTDVFIGIFCGALLALSSWPLLRVFPNLQNITESLSVIVGNIPFLGMVALAISAGFAEEVVFRGTIWGLVRSSLGDFSALILTSLLFGLAHFAFNKDFVGWGIYAGILGLILGIIRWTLGGILACVICHIIIDLINLPLVARFGKALENHIPPPTGGPRG